MAPLCAVNHCTSLCFLFDFPLVSGRTNAEFNDVVSSGSSGALKTAGFRRKSTQTTLKIQDGVKTSEKNQDSLAKKVCKTLSPDYISNYCAKVVTYLK